MKEDKYIYFVEDNELFAMSVKIGLENKGYKVKHFSTGEQMLDSLTEKPYLIILDYLIESNDGTAKNGKEIMLEAMSVYSDVPVIVLSAINDLEEATALLKMGAVDFIPKGECFFENLTLALKNITTVKELKKEIKELKAKTKQYRQRLSFVFSIFIVALALVQVFG